MNENQNKGLVTVANVASSFALGATGLAMFTTAAPVLTGVCIGAAILGSGVSAYSNYVAHHYGCEKGPVKIDSAGQQKE